MDRYDFIRRFNPVLTAIDHKSPLSAGNGDFAFTCDITGLQTLPSYTDAPLCTMSTWGWHTEPDESGKIYSPDDLDMTKYGRGGRVFKYPVEHTPENENVYKWLRHNPHRLNLARFFLLRRGKPIQDGDITDIRQELDLYAGMIHSEFRVNGALVRVLTFTAGYGADVLGFSVRSEALRKGKLSAALAFPYGSHKKSASDWTRDDKHTTEMTQESEGVYLFNRTLDSDRYAARIVCASVNTQGAAPDFIDLRRGGSFETVMPSVTGAASARREGAHRFVFSTHGADTLTVTAHFMPGGASPESMDVFWSLQSAMKHGARDWKNFWETGGVPDYTDNPELTRRAVLSMYQTAVHSAGSMPPQETGLLCNSWYGKFHLEMHIIHAGWFALWDRPHMLGRSFAWYEKILPAAKANALRNGYAGARWPKMTGLEGRDSPSFIAPLLIWQQPHIIYMLDLVRAAMYDFLQPDFMKRYFPLVRETADFMADFAEYNAQTGAYDLLPPIIPVQEEHAPMDTKNPTFELCYWRYGLHTACEWAKALGEPYDKWQETERAMAKPEPINGYYPAHGNCADTFAAFNRDHPSMLYALGFIPENLAGLDSDTLRKTADKVLDCWDKQTLWGWDFAFTAMTYAYLGDIKKALGVLLTDTPKNTYVTSGNNYQEGRDDLPLYLPGNGALLFALGMIEKYYGIPNTARLELE